MFITKDPGLKLYFSKSLTCNDVVEDIRRMKLTSRCMTIFHRSYASGLYACVMLFKNYLVYKLIEDKLENNLRKKRE